MIEWLSIGWPVPQRDERAAIRVVVASLPGTPSSRSIGAWMTQGDTPPATTDTSSLATVYGEYSAAIHTYAFHLLGNHDDADDVVQEVFIRAYSHLAELRDPAKLKSWLYRIATNLCMDALRRRSRVRRVLGMALSLTPYAEDDDQQAANGIAEPGSTAGIDGVAERDHIARALRKMPPKYAACLLLHSVQGLSYREIAEALGLTPGAAAVRLTRARDLFAKYYDELKGGEQP